MRPICWPGDPALFFGPTIGVVLIEGYGEIGGNRLRLGQGFAAPVVGSVRTGPQRGIYRFERSGGGLRAVQGAPDGSGRDRFRPAALPDGKAEGYTPAPMPDRAVSGGDGAFRRLDTGGGPGGGQGSGNRPPPGPERSRPRRSRPWTLRRQRAFCFRHLAKRSRLVSSVGGSRPKFFWPARTC